jgi:tetratricopeptide (TPR) repeat protein
MTTGDPDGEEADAIRDAMEDPWYAMSRSEQQLVRGLSADLYTIGQPPVSDKRESIPSEELQQFVDNADWPAVLEVVRSKQTSLDADEAAFLRAVAWMHLGQPEVALCFLREVERLRPLSDSDKIWLLTCLMQTVRLDETLKHASAFAESPNPLVRLRASNALSLAAQKLPSSESDKTRLHSIALAEEALGKVEPLISEDRTAKLLWQSTLFQLALDYEEIDNTPKAVSSCRRLLEEQPNNFDAQMLMDWLILQEDPDQANAGFRRHFRERLPQRTSLELTGFPQMALN